MSPARRIVKYALLAFVAASAGFAIYKAMPCCSGGDTEQAAVAEAKAPTAAEAAPVAPAKAARKTAVVYYFYTTARCYSCNLIEAYTREAVQTRFAKPYNGWEVTFKGVNIDEKANEHFTRDYWLSSKSVVVQKFEGQKPLNWGLLKSVWQLLGDKEKFMDYVAAETRKVLDSK